MAVVKALEWVPVDSSVVKAAGYRADAQQLYVQFHSGDIYRYFEFPLQRYEDFLAADSKGRYFSQHIRNRFRYERVRRKHQVSSVKRPNVQACTR
jgi:hypothetical protein